MTGIKDYFNEIKGVVRTKESIILIYSGLGLLLIDILGKPHVFNSLALDLWMHTDGTMEIKLLSWWAIVNLLFYMCIPMLLIRKLFKEKWSEYGLSLKNTGGNKIYLYFFIFMIPLVFIVSYSASFQERYPYYQLQNGEKLWPFFVVWEFLYALQFLALEFFFRGFMVHGLKQKFGIYSVFIMVVPYCMIHFGKPIPEAIGSILAGIALGYLSFKKNSVIPGAILHFGVALTMDLAALWQKGFF